ncbi:DUF6412 domain-containing protein [Streptomyces sp. UNOC14_S4]|uniref:DUF6412 domain-containing protein n=1 Tax=Streptomyces sp. UNOC14_S4 TaxID=2872340 RepID=UPI001E2C2A18|nr:DUF6412 domain-containing protein [Streptomyces sp. UNOC14_S4]MCC3767411.1 hypothetical protein [Streptomyces sp. UNOC14_S4]
MVNHTLRMHVSLLLLLFGELLLAHGGGLMGAVAVAATATVAAGLALSLITAAVASGTGPLTPTRIRTAIRDREFRTAFLAQRDPDARGRRRPRAPGRPLPTAA